MLFKLLENIIFPFNVFFFFFLNIHLLFRSHSQNDRDATSRSHRAPGYGLQVWEHPNHCFPLGWITNQDLGKVEPFWSKYLHLISFSSLLADISLPLPPTTPDARTEAARGRLTGTTSRVTPTLPPHTETTGSRKLPRPQKSATRDRGTMCPSKNREPVIIDRINRKPTNPMLSILPIDSVISGSSGKLLRVVV